MDSLTLPVILAFSVSVKFAEALDLIKILCLLFLELGNFEEEGVDILAEYVSLVRLLGDISLETRDVNLLAGSLVTSGSEVLLHIGNNASLLIH